MRHTPGKRVFRVVVVPGGSKWKCTGCGMELQPGEKAAKSGKLVFCPGCISKENEK